MLLYGTDGYVRERLLTPFFLWLFFLFLTVFSYWFELSFRRSLELGPRQMTISSTSGHAVDRLMILWLSWLGVRLCTWIRWWFKDVVDAECWWYAKMLLLLMSNNATAFVDSSGVVPGTRTRSLRGVYITLFRWVSLCVFVRSARVCVSCPTATQWCSSRRWLRVGYDPLRLPLLLLLRRLWSSHLLMLPVLMALSL